MNATELTAQQIWLPGKGLVPSHARAALQAVEEYESDLTLGRHEQTGEWIVMLKRGPEGRPFPVFGLGTELPSPEAIKQKLYQSDVRRHGGKIALALQKEEDRKRAAQRKLVSDSTEVAAEGMDWAMRKQGVHPFPRIYVPKGVKT